MIMEIERFGKGEREEREEGGGKRQTCTIWDLCMYDEITNSLLCREQRARYTLTNREVCEPSLCTSTLS